MGSSHSRGNFLESAISICILAILVIIGTGILIKQSNYDMSRFGISTADIPLSSQKTQINKEEMIDLSILAPAGFTTLLEVETYTADNLFEKINGKAPLYTESGFEKLFTQRFADKNDQNQIAELYIYDMGAVKNAFSVYSVQKRAGTKNLPDFTFAYKTENAIYLAHGKYYIELVGFSESPRLFEAMTEICRKIQSNLSVGQTAITELALFPKDNLVSGGNKLYLSSAFGFQELTDTFTAQYKIDNETVTVFFSKRLSNQDAVKLAENYYNFLINNGGVAKQSIDKTVKYKVVDFYGTAEIVSATGPFVFGVHEAENQQSAERLATKLAKALSKAVKVVK